MSVMIDRGAARPVKVKATLPENHTRFEDLGDVFWPRSVISFLMAWRPAEPSSGPLSLTPVLPSVNLPALAMVQKSMAVRCPGPTPSAPGNGPALTRPEPLSPSSPPVHPAAWHLRVRSGKQRLRLFELCVPRRETLTIYMLNATQNVPAGAATPRLPHARLRAAERDAATALTLAAAPAACACCYAAIFGGFPSRPVSLAANNVYYEQNTVLLALKSTILLTFWQTQIVLISQENRQAGNTRRFCRGRSLPGTTGRRQGARGCAGHELEKAATQLLAPGKGKEGHMRSYKRTQTQPY